MTGTYAAVAAPYLPGEVADGEGMAFTMPPLQITTFSITNASSSQQYSQLLSAAGGTGTGYIWSIISGVLPNGFSLSPAGVISSNGNPAATVGAYLFTVQVTDSAGNTATQPLTLLVMSDKSLGNRSCDCPGAAQHGDPIDVGSGNVFEQVPTIKRPGANKLVIRAYYNSLGSSTTLAASLGKNWRTTYDRYLQIGTSQVLAERADGQVLTFHRSGSSWTSDSDVDVKLTRIRLDLDADRSRRHGRDLYGQATRAYLTSIQARDGYTQTLNYNASNQLISVTDSYSRR